MIAPTDSLHDHFSGPPDPLAWADLSTDPPPPAPAWLDRPVYVGAVDVGHRDAFGPVALEIEITDSQVHLGPYVLSAAAAARLARLLTVAAATLGEPAAPARAHPLWREAA